MKQAMSLLAVFGFLVTGCVSVKGNVHVEENGTSQASALRHAAMVAPGGSEPPGGETWLSPPQKGLASVGVTVPTFTAMSMAMTAQTNMPLETTDVTNTLKPTVSLHAVPLQSDHRTCLLGWR